MRYRVILSVEDVIEYSIDAETSEDAVAQAVEWANEEFFPKTVEIVDVVEDDDD